MYRGKRHIGYESQAKTETKVLLAAYELRTEKNFSFDEMTYVLNEPKIQVDHIASKRPSKDNKEYTYYPQKEDDGKEIVIFKEGSDYLNVPGVVDRMDYDVFLSRTLHRTGNLQLLWKQKNLDKSNGLIKLPDYQNFYEYSQIEERAKLIAKALVDNKFFDILH